MSKKPENLNTIRQSCGSRVVVNGVSCISPITDREMYDSSLLYSAAKNKHAKESLVWKPMSEDWKENLQGRVLVPGYGRRSDQITSADGQTPV